MTNSEKLARAFSRVLRNRLTDEEMAEVIRLNAAETNLNICHTHDFCDANMAMDAAHREAFGTEPDTMSDDADDVLWDVAWDQAKRSSFYPPQKGGE